MSKPVENVQNITGNSKVFSEICALHNTIDKAHAHQLRSNRLKINFKNIRESYMSRGLSYAYDAIFFGRMWNEVDEFQ